MMHLNNWGKVGHLGTPHAAPALTFPWGGVLHWVVQVLALRQEEAHNRLSEVAELLLCSRADAVQVVLLQPGLMAQVGYC